MKRFLTMVVAACAFFAVSAQNPMVTLSHNGELSFFTNLSAFEAAVDAAEDGDILYLSEGKFTATKDTVTINKCLSIQGAGYKSHLTCNLLFKINTPSSETATHKLLDGLRTKGVVFYMDSIYRNNVKGVEIANCKIENLINAGYAAKDVFIKSCDLGFFDPDGASSSNVLIQNSKIHDVYEYVNNQVSYLYVKEMGYVTAINCNFRLIGYLPRVAISCILGPCKGTWNQYHYVGQPSMYNTLYVSAHDVNSIKKYDCYPVSSNDIKFDENLNFNGDLSEYLGEDGNVVGIMGGESPFSENPSVPTVDTANSSVTYDSSTNKLNVNITVKAD